jgi:hypothetical protein
MYNLGPRQGHEHTHGTRAGALPGEGRVTNSYLTLSLLQSDCCVWLALELCAAHVLMHVLGSG